MSGFRFHVGNRGGVKVVVFDDGGCRPASDAEVEMWDALAALRAENERLTTERDDDPAGRPEHVCQYRAEADAQCVLLAEISAAVRELDAAMPKCAAGRRYIQHGGHARVQAAIDALVGLDGAIEKGDRG